MNYNSYNLKNSETFITLYNELAFLNKSSIRIKKEDLFDVKGVLVKEKKNDFCNFFFNRYITSVKYKDTHFWLLLKKDSLNDDDLNNLKKYLEFFETFLLIIYTLTQPDLKNAHSDNWFIKNFNLRLESRSMTGLYYDDFKKLCRELCICTAKAVSTIKNYYTNNGYTTSSTAVNYQELNIYFRKFSMIFSSCKFYNITSYNFDNNLVVIIESLVHINHLVNLIRKDEKKKNVIVSAQPPLSSSHETPTKGDKDDKEEGEISDDDDNDVLESTINQTNRKKRKIEEDTPSGKPPSKKLNNMSSSKKISKLKWDGKKKSSKKKSPKRKSSKIKMRTKKKSSKKKRRN